MRINQSQLAVINRLDLSVMKYVNQALLICVIALSSFSSCKQSEMQNITAQDVKYLIESQHDYTIIDVRTPEEYAEGFIAGATNIDVKNDNFLLEIEKLNKNDKYIVYCRSGKRSSKAYGLMSKSGFKNLTNMKGGYLAYTGKK